MKKLSYFELRKKSKNFLWSYGVKNNFIDAYAQKIGYNYFDKITILEILSVYHTEWSII